MAKKKSSPQGKIQPAELVRRAEEALQHHHNGFDEAIRWLLRAESDIQRYHTKSDHPKVAAAAGTDDLRSTISTLLASALFNRALSGSDLKKKIHDLEESVKRASQDGRYLLALGIAQLSTGSSEKATIHLQKAAELLPEQQTAQRAQALGLLAVGNTRKVKEWFKQHRQEIFDADLTRLRAVCELMDGNLEMARTLLGCTPPPAASSSAAAPPAVSYQATQTSSSPLPGPPSPPHHHHQPPLHQQSGAAVRDVRTEASSYEQLLCSLIDVPLIAGDREQAAGLLAELPPPADDKADPLSADTAVFAMRLFYRGVLHFQTKRFAEAAADFKGAQHLASVRELNLPWRHRLVPYYHRIAEELIATDASKSIECWKQVLEIDPHDKQAHANLDAARRIEANRCWQDKLYERAVELWQESLKHHPQDEMLLRNAAIGCEKTSRKDQAIIYWRKLMQLWRPQLKNRGADKHFEKQLLQAEKHLIDLMFETSAASGEIQKEIEAAVKIIPDNSELRRLSVEMYLGMGRPGQALKQIESLERLDGESIELLLLKGVTLSMLNRLQPARQSIERAYGLDPTNAAARQAFLLILDQEAREAHDNKQLTLAADLCEQQLSIDPRYRPALSHVACLYFHLGEPVKAREAITSIIALDPHKAENHAAAGVLYLDHGKTREAEAEFKKAVAMNPSAESYRRIGESYLHAGKMKKALTCFDQAAETGSFVTLMEIAETLHDADKDREAEKYVDLAVSKEPEQPIPHLIKAMLLVGREDIEKALEELTEVERLSAAKSEYQEIAAQARRMRKEMQQMREFEQMLRGMEGAPGRGPIPPELLRMLKRLG